MYLDMYLYIYFNYKRLVKSFEKGVKAT